MELLRANTEEAAAACVLLSGDLCMGVCVRACAVTAIIRVFVCVC